MKEVKGIMVNAPQMCNNIDKILEEFAGLFKEPHSLPPSREVDHHILLKEGVSAVNVHPYRYAQFQKK